MNAAVTTSYFEGISRIYYTTLMCPIGFESSATLIESGNNLLQFCNFLSRYRFEPYTEMHLFSIFGHHISFISYFYRLSAKVQNIIHGPQQLKPFFNGIRVLNVLRI